MRSEVTAFSRHQHLVLYDPASIPPDIPLDPDIEAQEPNSLLASAMANLAEQGQALILRIAHEDCQAVFRLLVEETAEAYLRERAVQVIDGVILRIPSGSLNVHGIEFLCRQGENFSPLPDYRARGEIALRSTVLEPSLISQQWWRARFNAHEDELAQVAKP